MAPRKARVVVFSAPNAAGALSVVEVSEGQCVLSSGEILIVRYEKLRTLCEQVAQEQCPVTIRTWWTPDGNELVELRRGETPISGCSDSPSSKETPNESF